MRDSTFYILVGTLALLSLGCGIAGYVYTRRKEKGGVQRGQTFQDLLEDNAPDYPIDDTEVDYPYGSDETLNDDFAYRAACKFENIWW